MTFKFSPVDRARALLIGVTLLSASLSFVIVYVTLYVSLGGPDNRFSAMNMGSKGTDTSSISRSSGVISSPLPAVSFVRPSKLEKTPDIEFIDRNGVKKTLGDFRGKIILLNLWATWCVPCREEMPSLDRLQKEMGSDQFEVVALSLDRAGKQAAEKFFSEINLQHLQLYIDSTMKAGTALRAVGMPTTILINKDGFEIGRLPGPAEWDSSATKALLKDVLN